MRRPDSTLRPEKTLAAWEAAQPSAALAPVRVRCRLTTPMYGGGVTPGEVDCAMPIRPTAIRGQLRFWWRLLYGAERAPRSVFAAESRLWGGIAGSGPRASRVVLHVDAEPAGSAQMVEWGSPGLDAPRYALILEPGRRPSLLKVGYEFTLSLRFARGTAGDERMQVLEALRWWASFGGVGARTRRGLGAVEVTSDDVEITPVSPDEVRSNGGRMVLRSSRSSRRNPDRPDRGTTPPAVQAWKEAVGTLDAFRQGKNVGRNPGGSRPGRSRWPEPDAIRRLTGRHAAGHEPQHPAGAQYPRAAFGLPIVFQFKGRKEGDPEGTKGKGLTLDPTAGALEPAGKPPPDRMASPLILRPYFDGTHYRPLALLLPGWERRVSLPVALAATRIGPAWPEDAGERARLAALVPPLQGRGTDVLTAFLHHFEHSTPTGRRREAR